MPALLGKRNPGQMLNEALQLAKLHLMVLRPDSLSRNEGNSMLGGVAALATRFETTYQSPIISHLVPPSPLPRFSQNRLLRLKVIYHAINDLQVDFFKGRQRLGDSKEGNRPGQTHFNGRAGRSCRPHSPADSTTSRRRNIRARRRRGLSVTGQCQRLCVQAPRSEGN
jgi:hypothetical protein